MPVKKSDSSGKKKERKSIGQMTETGVPSKKVTGKQLTIEMGGSGTNLLNGQLEEDYNAALLGTIGLEIYDRMRKSDAQVHATLLYCELPILSTKWSIEPAKNEEGESEPEDEEIAEFVRKALFERMANTFQDFLREILTMNPFGHSIFEPVWEIDEEQVWIKKMGWRKPTTIDRWETEERAAGVIQVLPDGKKVSIPADKLLIFTLRREGDNYAGQSVLRTAYRHWLLKDKFYRFDSVRHERQSLGVLKIHLPVDATSEDEAKALRIIERLRNVEQAGITLPGGEEEQKWEADFMDMKAGTTSNLFESINHHDRKIATNILAQFMELGSDGGGGSYALSEDQSSMFLQAQGSQAAYIRDVINRHLIQKLVDYNYDVERYPTLVFDRLGEVKITDFATAAASLAGAGLLTTDPNTEAAVRERINLPPKQAGMEEDDEEEPIDPNDPMAGLEDPADDDGGDDEGDFDDVEEEPADDEEVDLSELFFSDIRGIVELGEDAVCEVIQLAKGKPLTEEHKKAISEALLGRGKGGKEKKPSPRDSRLQKRDEMDKERRAAGDRIDERTAARGGDTKALLRQKETVVQRIEVTRARIQNISDQYRASIEAAETPAERKRLRTERKALLTPLKQLRTSDIQTRVGVNKILRARRKQLSAKIQAIRSAVKEKRLTMKDAVEPLRNEIEANNAKIKELRALRKRGGKGEKSKALQLAIDGLLEDNATIRGSAKALREVYSDERDKGQKEIETKKKESGFFSEHHDPPIFFELSQLLNNETIIQLQNEVEPLQLAEAKKKGLRTNSYERKAWRPLTLAERNVNFTLISRSMKDGTAKLEKGFRASVLKARTSLIEQIKFAVKYNDIKALGKVAVPKDVLKEMAAALTDVQKEMFEVGKRTAAQELNAGSKPGDKDYLPVPPTSPEIRGAMRVQNDAIAGKIAWNLEAVAVQAATEAIQKAGGGKITETTQKAALDAVKEAMDAELQLSEQQQETIALCETKLDETIKLAEATANTLSVTGSVNMGRGSIFARYPERVYGFQFSAILDDRTTAICMSLDGIVVKAGSQDYDNYSPPRHINCRSIWVAILIATTFKPEFTRNISASIPTNKTAATAPTMKAPVVGEHTSEKTVALINEEIEERTAKVAEYLESGKFANRVEKHKEAIKALQQGLQGVDVGVKQSLTRKIVLEGGTEIRTPTGYVYHASTPDAQKSIAKKGLVPNKDEKALYFAPDGSIASAAGALKNDTVLYRIPAGEVGKLKPKPDPHMPPGVPTFYIENTIAPDVIEVWDDVKEEWIPVKARGANPELAEVMRGIFMADGIRFTVRQ